MLIVYSDPGGGWAPVTYMVSLAAELLEAELFLLDPYSKEWSSLRHRLEIACLKRNKNNLNTESCLFICPAPTCLLGLAFVEGWRKRFKYVGAWIFDSFWVEDIPWAIKNSRQFDFFFITSKEDIPEWNRLTGTETYWLPWGTDVLRLGGSNLERNLDLVRVGRQPPTWDDDLATEELCRVNHLSFHGRPKEPGTARQGFAWAADNQNLLMSFYRRSKFTLAFSNLLNPTNYTHPFREYLTARWVDSLAAGAIVAGVAPKSPSAKELLWSGATLDLGSVDREQGMQIIAEAVRQWRPEQAVQNYHLALKRLDWRWRFVKIAEAFNESPQCLQAELELLKSKIEQSVA